MQVQAKRNPAPKEFANFRAVVVLLRRALHPALLVDNTTLDDAVTDGLANNVLRIFFRVEVQLNADVSEGDARVRKRQSPNAGLDDVLSQSNNETVSLVGLKLGCVF